MDHLGSAHEAPTGGAAGAGASTVLRFSLASRVVHWALAVPFLLLLTTGLLLYVPEVKALHAGGYRLVPLLHVLCGIVFSFGLPAALLLQPGRRRLWSDLGRLFSFAPSDLAWLRYAGYALLGAAVQPPPTGKFNAGQKLNALATTVFTVGLVASGAVLAVNYFTKVVFSASFVESVYPLHDVFTVIAVPVIAGHLYFAIVNPGTRPALRGMFGGRVNRGWARSHHALWVTEIESASEADGEAATRVAPPARG